MCGPCTGANWVKFLFETKVKVRLKLYGYFFMVANMYLLHMFQFNSCQKWSGRKLKLVFCKYANKYSHVTFVFDEYQHFGAHKGSIQSKHYVKSNLCSNQESFWKDIQKDIKKENNMMKISKIFHSNSRDLSNICNILWVFPVCNIRPKYKKADQLKGFRQKGPPLW